MLSFTDILYLEDVFTFLTRFNSHFIIRVTVTFFCRISPACDINPISLRAIFILFLFLGRQFKMCGLLSVFIVWSSTWTYLETSASILDILCENVLTVLPRLFESLKGRKISSDNRVLLKGRLFWEAKMPQNANLASEVFIFGKGDKLHWEPLIWTSFGSLEQSTRITQMKGIHYTLQTAPLQSGFLFAIVSSVFQSQ